MSVRHQYLVDRYSQNLTKYDIMQLFERLRQNKGTITAATKEAEITRKTVNDWEKNTEDVKIATKRKILEANLEADLLGTLDYLVRKDAVNYHEILKRYANTALTKLQNLNDSAELKKKVTEFEEFLRLHRGGILDTKTISFEGTIGAVNQKADSLEVQRITKDFDFMSPQITIQKFLHLLEIFNKKSLFKDEIADKLGLSKDFVEKACSAISYVDPSTQPDEEIEKLSRFMILNPDPTSLAHRLGLENFQDMIAAQKE